MERRLCRDVEMWVSVGWGGDVERGWCRDVGMWVGVGWGWYVEVAAVGVADGGEGGPGYDGRGGSEDEGEAVLTGSLRRGSVGVVGMRRVVRGSDRRGWYKDG